MSDGSIERKLANPPIHEVICGLYFAPLRGLDPVVLGQFWDRLEGRFPGREIHPAVGFPSVVVGPRLPPLRTWFVTEDGVYVLQIQQDRFYLNWRRMPPESEYPRFSRSGGILDRFFEEFGRFSEFCQGTLGQEPNLIATELGKVDVFLHGKAWKDKNDLGKLFPLFQDTIALTTTENPALSLQFKDESEGMTRTVVISTVAPKNQMPRHVRLETNLVRPIQADGRRPDRAFFLKSNEQANEVFFVLIPEEERIRRFGGKVSAS